MRLVVLGWSAASAEEISLNRVGGHAVRGVPPNSCSTGRISLGRQASDLPVSDALRWLRTVVTLTGCQLAVLSAVRWGSLAFSGPLIRLTSLTSRRPRLGVRRPEVGLRLVARGMALGCRGLGVEEPPNSPTRRRGRTKESCSCGRGSCRFCCRVDVWHVGFMFRRSCTAGIARAPARTGNRPSIQCSSGPIDTQE